jgi:hypothetical protein
MKALLWRAFSFDYLICFQETRNAR